MQTTNLLKTVAVAGLLGLGAMSTPAAARDYRVCDSYGCRWVHENDGYRYDEYSGSYYHAPSYYSDSSYYRDGYAWRHVRICDRYGCRYERRYVPRASVEFQLGY